MKKFRQQVGVIAAIKYKDKFLFTKRHEKSKYEAGRWGFVGGAIEFGENPLEALKREVKEEVGLEISSANFFNMYSQVFESKNEVKHVMLLLFICEPKTLEVKKGFEVSEAKWLTLEEANNLELIKGNEIILQDLNKVFL